MSRSYNDLFDASNLIAFDSETHIYKINGEEYPSVTTILKDIGLIDTRWYTKKDSDKGRKIHTVLELADKEELDWDTLTDTQLTHVQNWFTFQSDYNVTVEAIELPIYHPFYKYAGTIDRLCIVNGNLAVVDIKSGGYVKWHALQLGLYGMIIEHVLKQPVELYDVYTKSYKVRKIDRTIYSVCEAVLAVYRWKHDIK